jgi:hypothetical protein
MERRFGRASNIIALASQIVFRLRYIERKRSNDIVRGDRADFIDGDLRGWRFRKKGIREQRETHTEPETRAVQMPLPRADQSFRFSPAATIRVHGISGSRPVRLVGLDDVAHQTVTHHVRLVEILEGDAIDSWQKPLDLD